jgi:hypothetical protein
MPTGVATPQDSLGRSGRSPRTNRVVERMNRTPLDECFRVAGRQTSCCILRSFARQARCRWNRRPRLWLSHVTTS